jgi:dCTP deaminase
MLLSDRQIQNLCESEPPLISPWSPELIREVAGQRVISHGSSSYGYDLTLSSADIKIFRRVPWFLRFPGRAIDPKNFNPNLLESPKVYSSGSDRYFILPNNSYALGVTNQRFVMPRNLTGICLGKSTYARTGLIVNTTPLEAGWEGHLTLELSNSSPAPLKIYLDEGIAQVLFYEGHPCRTSYADRGGKYQGQGHEVTLARA